LGPGVAERFAFSSGVTDEQVAKGNALRAKLTRSVKKLLAKDGVLILPSMPDIAPLTTASEGELEDFRNRALNMLLVSGLTGLPQVSIPVARRDGAPMGLSIIGPAGSDRSLIDLAVKMENTGRIRLA
jgi:amidase